jgi:predicted metalloprotease
MRWTPGGRSRNLEDRRSSGGIGRGLGIGGTVVVLALSLITGRNLFNDLGVEPGVGAGGAPMSAADSAREEPQVLFVSHILDDTQNTWAQIMARNNAQYQPARLVLFRNSTQSGCGVGQSAMGPFYCPLDQKVYIDLAFYDELQRRFGASGDFAQAYVLAHEIGHHVQNLSGTAAEVRQAQQQNPGAANQLSVRMELQADCYAGVWANSTQVRGKLEEGDVDEALGAAAAVGDDRIQQQSGQRVNVDGFTHGSAAQRAEWFRRGLTSGDPRACDTFSS